ncbi:MAG: hypothetical protein AAGF23_20405 [Acidobacteriota bacterium]
MRKPQLRSLAVAQPRPSVLVAAVVGLLILALFLVLPGPASADGLWDHLDTNFANNAYWFDGKAEVNLYDASIVIYGEPREAEEVAHVVVTEDLLPDSLVKADNPGRAGLVPALKLNYTTEARTGVYTYRQMLSFFFDRRTMGAAKMTLTHNEWCGNTFKQLVNFEGRSSYDFNTYWEGGGDGSFDVDFPRDLVIYDSIPVQLRALRFQLGLQTGVKLLPRQLSSRATEPEVTPAVVRVTHREKVTVPAGDFDAFRVELEHSGGLDQLHFEAEYPHRMLRWQRADRDLFELAHSEKMPYWQYNRPADAKRLPH